jgi:hypothetical protein
MSNIISIKQGIPVMKNSLGAQWTPSFQNGRYGFGFFSYQSIPLGAPLFSFLSEENLDTAYTVSDYTIMENSPHKGVLRFSGISGKLGLTITATMTDLSPCVTFSYDIDPIHPAFHRVYVRIPFYSEKSLFFKYPYEDTLYSDSRRWTVETDISRTPVVFGCEEIEGKHYYLCAGYHLADPFDEGRFEIDPSGHPEAPFQLYSPFKGMARHLDLQCITELELLRADLSRERKDSIRHFRFLVSMGDTQYDCLKGYIDNNGYDLDPHISYSIEQACEQLYHTYKTAPGYIPQKGYTQLIRTDTGRYDSTVPHGWYSKYICPGPSVQLGYELYHYYLQNPHETWAKERAFEMADFLVKNQFDNGLFTNINTDTAQLFSEGNGDTFLSDALSGYFFNAADMNLGAYHLYMLYDEVKAREGEDHTAWKTAAQKTIRATMSFMGEDGSLGRNYNLDGNYDVLCAAASETLMALTYMYQDTGDQEVLKHRDLLENWVYTTYIFKNDYADNCMDGGAWVGGGKPPKDNDTMGLMGFVCYCVQRYQETGQTIYLQRAKDTFIYQLLCTIPIELPGFTHRTRGLIREQDFYSAFDLPMRVNDYLDCLPYLSAETDDPLFARFGSVILQTEMDYQEKTNPYRGFHIGLQCDYDARTPIDSIAERNSIYIIRFAALFLKAVQSPLNYPYAGGKTWGVGRDYYLPFQPNLGEKMPYIRSCTGMVRNITVSPDRNRISIWVYDVSHSSATIEIVLDGFCQPDALSILTSDASYRGTDCYNPKRNSIHVTITNASAPSKMIDLIRK